MERLKGFDQVHSINILAGATTTIYEETLPSGIHLKITHFMNYTGNAAAWGNVVWRLCKNGVPLWPLDHILDQMGEIPDPYEISEDVIIEGGSRVTLEAYNGGGIAYDVGAGIKGFYFKA